MEVLKLSLCRVGCPWVTGEGNCMFDDLYTLSNCGIITNKSTGKILKHRKDKDGYCVITISINGKKHEYKIHRLVATKYIYNPDGKLQVNHINGIKDDNRVENLEWVTHKENAIHSVNVLKNNSHVIASESQSICVVAIDENGIIVGKFKSISEASRIFGCGASNISACCNGKHLKAKNMYWQHCR